MSTIKRRWRIITTERKLYITAVDSTAVRAMLARNGLMQGERVLSMTAISNAGLDGGILDAR